MLTRLCLQHDFGLRQKHLSPDGRVHSTFTTIVTWKRGPDGRILLEPVTVIETKQNDAANPTPDVAGC